MTSAIEVIFARHYYQGRDFGVWPDAHLRLRWPDGGVEGALNDPGPMLLTALREAPGVRDVSGGWLEKVDGPVTAERILQLARGLAEALGEPVGQGSILHREDGRTADLRLPAADAMVTAGTLRLTVMAANGVVDPAAVSDEEETPSLPEYLRHALSRLARVSATRRAGPAMEAIIAAADERRIPHIRFDRWPFLPDDHECLPADRGVLQLGEGHCQQRLRGSLPGNTLRETLEMLADHWAVWLHLRERGLPVPARDPNATNIITTSRARRAASMLGYPVVVKPRVRSRGVGVTCGVGDDEALTRGMRAAQEVIRQVIVERQAPGVAWRLLAIDGEVVAARARSESGSSIGATPHAGYHDLASRALEGLGLRVAGVDVVTPDITVAPTEVDSVVIGIDPAPDLTLHCLPGENRPWHVARRLVDALFPPGAPYRIPKAAVTGTNGKTTTTHLLAHILRQTGDNVCLTSTSGRFLNGELVVNQEASGGRGALDALLDARVEAAVLETARGEMVHKGLAFHEVDVAACTNVERDHIGLDGIETLDQMAVHKRQVLEKATECAVLNGEDARCLAMMPHLRARRVCLFARNPDAEAVRAHVDAGGQAVVVSNDGGRPTLTLRDGARATAIIPVADMPCTWGGSAGHNIDNALCATGLATGLGLSPENIAAGLRSFQTSPEMLPGRLNRIDGLPFRVIVDAAHNAHGMRALGHVIRDLDHASGTRRLVFFAREEDSAEALDAMVAEVVDRYDEFICRDTLGTRDSEPGTCARALAEAMDRAGVASDRVTVIPDRATALRHALDISRPGDLLVLCTVWPGPTLDDLHQEVAARRP